MKERRKENNLDFLMLFLFLSWLGLYLQIAKELRQKASRFGRPLKGNWSKGVTIRIRNITDRLSFRGGFSGSSFGISGSGGFSFGSSGFSLRMSIENDSFSKQQNPTHDGVNLTFDYSWSRGRFCGSFYEIGRASCRERVLMSV